MSAETTTPEAPSVDIGRRENSLLWHLLNDNSLIAKVTGVLSPIDLAHNERDKHELPPAKLPDGTACPVYVAGRVRSFAFDAIVNRDARTIDAVVECLSSKNNTLGHAIGAHLVDAFKTTMLELSGDDSVSMFGADPISDSFDSVFDSILADKRECEAIELAKEIASLDVTENVSLSMLSKRRQVTEYLIEGVFAKGQPGIGFGPPKAGKTNLLGVEVAYCLANGVRFLGRFNVPAECRVLFLSGESSVASLVESFGHSCKLHEGNVETDFERITISTWLPKFADANDLAELNDRIVEAAADVVIVDPAGPCMSAGSASTLAIAYAELRAFTDACLGSGATPLLLHHSLKGANVSALGLRAAAGAGFGEWARQWITLDRIGRFDPATGQHKLKMTAGGSAGHCGEWLVNWTEGNIAAGRKWDIAVKPVTAAAKAADADAKIADDAATIVEAMKSIATIETARTIRGRANLNGVRADAALAFLLEAGTITTRDFVKARQNCKGFELVGDVAKGVA